MELLNQLNQTQTANLMIHFILKKINLLNLTPSIAIHYNPKKAILFWILEILINQAIHQQTRLKLLIKMLLNLLDHFNLRLLLIKLSSRNFYQKNRISMKILLKIRVSIQDRRKSRRKICQAILENSRRAKSNI